MQCVGRLWCVTGLLGPSHNFPLVVWFPWCLLHTSSLSSKLQHLLLTFTYDLIFCFTKNTGATRRQIPRVHLLSVTASPRPVLPSFLQLLRVNWLCSHLSLFFSLGGCPKPSHLLRKGSRRSTYYPVASLFPADLPACSRSLSTPSLLRTAQKNFQSAVGAFYD